MGNSLKTPPYGNCHVQHPNGTAMFNCAYKKAKWYLDRNLAIIIQQDPLIIRLTFEPAGPGRADDAFYLQHRKNICVRCGTTESLTKHHVVPFCYRKFFSEELKNYSAYDILPLCHDCHEEYEAFANELKDEIEAELNVISSPNKLIDRKLKDVCLHASAILRHGDRIPEHRLDKLYDTLREYYSKPSIDREDLIKAASMGKALRKTGYDPNGKIPVGQLVVDRLDNIQCFVERWRKHFLDTMSPKFMPEHWSIERPIEKTRKAQDA